ncbi:MAG: uncharacterized protein JWO10_302, partial [Microbacteriaceae bacterium]|nr:uncharacterized protein [Microbacteriaceae bacterium]
PTGPVVALSQLELATSPRSVTGETTALLRSADIVPITDSPAQVLPTTVVSRDRAGDSQVKVTSTKRLLGLDISGTIAATIAGLGFGDKLVGRDVSTTFPPAMKLPLVTSGGHTINSEAILALKPSLIITDGTVGPADVLLQLRDAGIPVVFVDREPGLKEAGVLAKAVGTILGASATGALLAERLDADIAAKIAEIASIAPKAQAERLRMLFLYIRGNSGIYYLFGHESGADELITGLGGIDVATQIGWSGMKPMTDEAMVAANPDLILVMTDGIESTGGVTGLLAARPAIALTAAGEHRRFVDMADGEVLGFGPRTADVLDALARAIYTKR